MTDHPAKYSDGIVELFSGILDRYGVDHSDLVVDPFAGTGRIHLLPHRTIGVEIEPEWASMHSGTLCGDSRELLAVIGAAMNGRSAADPDGTRRLMDAVMAFRSVAALATSCTYGNRMADKHEARDDSKRMTYRHRLGRPLTEGNSGGMQWGEEYRKLHRQVWAECSMILAAGAPLILNCSNHIRGGEEINVTGWHCEFIRDELGMKLVEAHAIKTRRMGFGANAKSRTSHEFVLVFINQEIQPETEVA